MAESISDFGAVADTTLGSIATVAPYYTSWGGIFPSDGTQVQLGNMYGALNQGGLGGIQYTVAGIDPVIQFLLTVRLRTTGQIWPVGYS